MKLCQIVLEDLLVGLKLVPGNVAGMGVFYEDLPMLAGRRKYSPRVGLFNDAAAPIDKGSGIAGVVEELRDTSRIDRTEDHAALADTATDAAGKLESFAPESILHGMGGTHLSEGVEYLSHAGLDPRVWIEYDGTGGVVDQTDG